MSRSRNLPAKSLNRSRKSQVVVTNSGVRVYEAKNGKYWRITWKESGRQKDTSATSAEAAYAKAAQIEKRIKRASGDKESLPMNDLLAAYVDPSIRTVRGADWGAKHEHSQKSLIKNHIAPQIGHVICDELTNEQLQSIVKNAPTDSTAKHLQSAISALINWAHLDGWISTEPKKLLAGITHENRRRKKNRGARAGETELYVDRRDIPSHQNVHDLAKAAAITGGKWWYELLVNLDAYSGVRFGELFDLDIDSIDIDGREITVETQVLEVSGQFSRTAPKWGTVRKTVFPKKTPMGYDLQKALRKRVKELKSLNQIPTLADGSQRLLLFPNEKGSWMSHSNFSARVRRPAQEMANWPKKEDGHFRWNFHSLRHVFCTYYLFDLEKDLRDVSIAAGHRDYSTTMQMYVGQSEGAIKRLKSE
jgi:integrase